MTRCKYVIIDNGKLELPVLLPDAMSHDQAAQIGKPVSAGFCDLSPRGVHAWGSSVSLNLSSRGETDEQLIQAAFMRKGT